MGCPRQESNLRTRFRKPLLYPLSYGGGTNHDSVGHGVLRNISELPFSFPRAERGRGMALGRTMIALGVLIVIGSNGIAASASAPGTSGTWQAGRDGAQAGIYMTARPMVGQSRRQEYYKGHAEDHFSVLSLRASISVPYLTSHRALLTKEWTPLEPGTVDHKFYVRGIGEVKEVTVKGPTERSELVSVRRP